MNKLLLVILAVLLPLSLSSGGLDTTVLGYWLMNDGKTPDPNGVAYLYQYDNKIYGMVVVAVNPVAPYEVSTIFDKKIKAPYLKDSPYIEGLNILWELEWNEKKNRYSDGKITDPAKKGIFKAELWRVSDTLIVRGGLGAFWQEFKWTKAYEDYLPPKLSTTDLHLDMPPLIPEKK